MSILPEELWRRILEIGVSTSALCHRDLCCLSISCRRLRRLSNDDGLWSLLLSSDFPQTKNPSSSSNTPPNPSSKSLYRIRFERDKARKLAAHRRSVLRIESQIAVHSGKLQDLKRRSREEIEKLEGTIAELSNVQKVRQASVALNVWQPEVIRSRQKQLVEQSVVPIEYRINALEMEVKLCRQLIAGLDKAIRDEKRRIDAAKELLMSMNYHPMQDKELRTRQVNQRSMKRRKLKRSINDFEE